MDVTLTNITKRFHFLLHFPRGERIFVSQNEAAAAAGRLRTSFLLAQRSENTPSRF